MTSAHRLATAFLVCLAAFMPACVASGPPPLPPEQVPKLSVGILLFDYAPESILVTVDEAQKKEQEQQAKAQAASQTPGQTPSAPAEEQVLVLDNPERVHESIRRAESYYLAHMLKQELRRSPYFDTVKVVPDETEFFDIILAARIVRSNGHDFEVQVTAVDSRQQVWLERDRFEIEKLPAAAFETKRDAQGNEVFVADAYQPVFKDVIEALVDATPRTVEEFNTIEQVTTLRYVCDISPAAFPHDRYIATELQRSGVMLSPSQMPSEADPSFQRVRQVRANEERALEQFGAYYADGYKAVQEPYYYWRRDNREAVAYYQRIKEQAEREANIAMGMGVLAAVYEVAAGGDNTEERVVLGASQLVKMMETDADGEISFNPANVSPEIRQLYDEAQEKGMMTEELSDKMMKLGDAFAGHVEPRTIELMGRTHTFSGKIDEQFVKLRSILREVYAEESGFEVAEPDPAYASRILPRVAHARSINNQ